MPDDTNRFVLFHQTFGDMTNDSRYFYTVIDKTLDNGKGDVISKNNIALSGSFGGGMAACKHGNGRDWWVVAFSINADTIYKFLLTPNSVQYAGFQKRMFLFMDPGLDSLFFHLTEVSLLTEMHFQLLIHGIRICGYFILTGVMVRFH
ncbi:MAG: hypothetical protein HS118_11370 [Bacteroidia bacterium]|nr:hypothetical protein [Bacteroidia bacterium]